MTSTGLFAVVVPPLAREPRGATLLRSANLITETDPRWMQGITWRPLVCGSSDIVQSIGICGGAFSAFTTSAQPSTEQYVPPHVAVGLSCSAFSGEETLRDTVERASALLDRCQTLGIADELWTGTAAASEAPDLPNNFLTKAPATPNGVTATAVIKALADLEAYLVGASCAGPGMIHATVRTATYWASQNLVDRTPDGRLVTKLGTIVVADPGYDGSSPSGVAPVGETAWAYATGMVDVRLGPVELIPAEDLAPGVAWANNDFDVYAHRAFAATFDPCTLGGILVNHASIA
mgnify:CR=1 FL=1